MAGTDPPNLGINHGTDLYKELNLLLESGMPIVEVLKAATSNISNAFSIENTGYVKPGYNADFILLEGDVTKDLNILNTDKVIFKLGKQVK